MSTDAQFKEGEVVWYTNGDLSKELAVVTKVTQVNPAQYDVAMTKDSRKEVCGEGIDEAGSVQALS